ncbi:glycosyltransferase involved in cell wall biosynthesis [Rhizobium azibense]|nr:glycosyltransferase involved in cell wall biosynthesis [Rhizobium azibense]
MTLPSVVLLVNLPQDVNILRPLAFLAARDLGLRTRFVLSQAFVKGDRDGRWQAEIAEIAEATATPVVVVANEGHAIQQLQGLSGVIIAGSESNLPPHEIVHNIFRLAPPSFVTITLQHGFECVGFLQGREHDLVHGKENIFAADVVCGWCEPERLTAMAPSQHNKLLVAGPTAVLQQPHRQAPFDRGIVCENMHSVRLNLNGDFKTDFVGLFGEFCKALDSRGSKVVLRPHPAGQYALKNDVKLPKNAILNNNPIYKVNLTRYAYGISAPSSILIDMVLAGIPTAVWSDKNGIIDTDNYKGLATVSDLSDWIEFAAEASTHPERFIERQAHFIEKQKMVTDPAEVYKRYAELLWSAARRAVPQITRPPAPPEPERRVLFVANSYLPTLQLSFVKPLAPLVDGGQIATGFLTEQHMKDAFGNNLHGANVCLWIEEKLRSFKPSMIVFCRYSGPHAAFMTEWARKQDVPIMFHIDDDLLNIPLELGASKHAYHNDPKRLTTVRHLLDNSDLVYCSNPNLRERLKTLGAAAPLRSGTIYASGRVIVPAIQKPIRKVGYMASADHAHNLEMIKEAIVSFLRDNPQVHFELFGSIPKLAEFNEFGDRVTKCPPINNYEQFMESFAELEWDIGICPLVPTPFNVVKSNTKWVEYTSVGAAVIASRKTVYDECCADGCGILADTPQEWITALNRLTNEPSYRFSQVKNAQAKLKREYSTERLREQVLSFFSEAEASKIAQSYRIAE